MAKVKTADQRLETLKKHLTIILADTSIPKNENPFDLDCYSNNKFKSKKYVDLVLNELIAYYEASEQWEIPAHNLDWPRVCESLYSTAKKLGLAQLSHPILKAISGYLETDWFAVVPFSQSTYAMDFARRKYPSISKPTKIGPEIWILPIGSKTKLEEWFWRNRPKEITGIKKADREHSLDQDLHHQMCQIGGATYEGKIISGHYLIYRRKGNFRYSSAEDDISRLFFLFTHWLSKSGQIESNSLFFTSATSLRPEGQIGVDLKTMQAWRFPRFSDPVLNANISEELIEKIKGNGFGRIARKLSPLQSSAPIFKQLKTSVELLYQYIENEKSSGSGYCQSVISTVLLCSAAEALLGIADRQMKKKSFAIHLSAILSAKKTKSFLEHSKFLREAYTVRSNFVHDGTISKFDNERLFLNIFSAWLILAKKALKNPSDKKSFVSDFIKSQLPKHSAIFRECFISEIL